MLAIQTNQHFFTLLAIHPATAQSLDRTVPMQAITSFQLTFAILNRPPPDHLDHRLQVGYNFSRHLIKR